MKKSYAFLFKNWRRLGLVTAFALASGFSLQAQTAPAKLWDKTLGGTGFDNLTSVQQTSDGGYILGGHSDSGISGDKSQASQGGIDYWVVKIDATGTKLWDKTFGGSATETFRSIKQTADGGYILAGYSNSGLSGHKSQASKGSNDYWVIKLDANGNKTWDKTLGGSLDDRIYDIEQTIDGGYLLAGSSKSGISGDKSQANKGDFDYWVVKLNANGTKRWDKTYGGSGVDELYSIGKTTDGGFILGGHSTSGLNGDKTQASKGLTDYWVIKIDSVGNKAWDKVYGGTGDDTGVYAIQQTTDGGFIMAGTSDSGLNGDKSEASKGLDDFWIVKTDANGVKTWDKTIGGSTAETLRTMQQTSDGGYMLGGFSGSAISGDKSQVAVGDLDYWVVKLNASGNKTWDKTVGGTAKDNLHAMYQTSDGGFILGGMSASGQNGDKGQALIGGTADIWVVRLAAPPSMVPADMGVTAITSLSSGCNLTNQETITITVNNFGTAAQSNIPVSYKINTGTPVTEILAGPVAPNTSVNYSFNTKADLSVKAAYTIEARTTLAGDVLSANDAFSKVVNNYNTPAVPVITTSGATSVCSGSTITLTAASATTGVSYQWYLNGNPISGATSASYAANAGGSYTATAVVGGSCASPVSTAMVLTVNTTPPPPGVNYTGSLALCTGDSVLLTALSSVPGVTFTWFKNGNLIPGITSGNYMAKSAGNYTASATNNGCVSPPSMARTVTMSPAPATPTITRVGNTLVSSSTTGNQWFKNGVIVPGATQQNYNPVSNGSYTVKVTANGCTSPASNSISILNTGIADGLDGLALKVYPNPSKGMFYLELPQGNRFELTITDLTGNVMDRYAVSGGKTILNIRNYASGLYLLHVTGEANTATRKIIIE